MSTAEERAARRAEPTEVHNRTRGDGPIATPDAGVRDRYGAEIEVHDRDGDDWSILARNSAGEKYGVGGLSDADVRALRDELDAALAAKAARRG